MAILFRFLLSNILLTLWCLAAPQFKIQERDLLESRIAQELFLKGKLNLYGLSGMGKTVSSKRIKASLKKRGHDVVWLNWDEISFEEQIHNMIKTSKCANMDDFLLKLHNGRGGIIFIDNYNDENVKRLKEKLGKLWSDPEVKILITSQQKISPMNGFQMPPFSHQEALALMAQYFPTEDPKRLGNIVRILGAYPYFISMLCRLVEESNTLSIQRLEDILMHNPREILERDLTKEAEEEVTTSKGNIVIKDILAELKENDYEAYKVLGFLSILHSKSIPLELIHYFLKDKKEADRVIEKLLSMSFIASIHKGKDFITYDLHEITQRLINEMFSPQGKEEILAEGVIAFINFFKENYFKITDSKREAQVYFNHLNSVISLFPEHLKILSLKVILLKLPLISRKNFEMAAFIANAIEKFNPEKNIEDKDILFEYYVDQSFIKCYFHTEDEEQFKKGINYGKKAIQLAEGKGDLEQVFKANSRLMWIYLYAGNVKESTPHFERATSLLDKMSDPYSRKEYFFGASWYFLERGDFKQAYPLAKKGIELDEKSKNANIGLYLRQFKALCEYRFGELDDALQTVDDALSRANIEFADEPSFAEAELLQIRACINRDNLSFDRAEKDIRESIVLFDNERGDNPYYPKAVSLRILADILFNQGKIEEASKEINRALEVFRALVKNEGTYELAEAFFVRMKVDLKKQDFGSFLKTLKELNRRFSPEHEVVKNIYKYTIRAGQEWLLY